MMNMKLDYMEMKSPFALRRGELVEKMPTKEYCRFILLNDVQQEIILAVNKWLFLNRFLLLQYLVKKGCNINEEELKVQLKLLSENRYLDRLEFTCDGEKLVFRVYRVGRKGRGWLSANDIRIRLNQYVEQCSAVQVKKILSANQAVIMLGEIDELNSTVAAQIIRYNKTKKRSTKYIFRAYGYLEQKLRSLIVESVRREDDYIANVQEKLRRIDSVLKHKKKCNIVLKKKPVVLLVAEEREHMEQLRVYFEKRHYKYFELAFSYDRQLIDEADEKEKIYYQTRKSIWERVLAG